MANKNAKFQSIAPIVSVGNLEQALEYYQHVLGFDIAWRSADPANLASICRDSVELTLRESGNFAATPSRMYIEVAGIDAYYSELLASGLAPAVPLAERPYGMRDFQIIDPSGNELYFGEPAVK
jgi:uncharacterized glyoxalase superfamily protein PhnB